MGPGGQCGEPPAEACFLTKGCFLLRSHWPVVLPAQCTASAGGARASLGRLWIIWAGSGPFLRGKQRPQPTLPTCHALKLKVGGASLSTFLPFSLGSPFTHLGVLGHARDAGMSCRLPFLWGTSRETSAEPLKVRGGQSAAVGGPAWSWPWQFAPTDSSQSLDTSIHTAFLFLQGPLGQLALEG